MRKEYLSKSNFMHWLIHPAYLWLEKHDKKKLPPITQTEEFLFAKGHDFEAEARKIFPHGQLVDAKPWEFDELERQTKEFMDIGAEAIFQATVMTERKLLAKSDILKRNGEAWDLYEIKSSTRVKDDHLVDLAFQTVAWEESGIKINDIYICYVNRNYVRKGEIEADKLVTTEEITDAVREQTGKVERGVPKALETLRARECPDQDPGLAGALGVWLPIYFHLHPDMPEDHPYKLAQMNEDKLAILQRQGYESLTEITDVGGFNARQQSQIRAWQAEPDVDKTRIKQFLDKLEFPLWFLDYETISHAVPLYEGTRPYQEIPFQYSLHKLDSPEGELEHFEYLAASREFPVPDLSAHLREHLGEPGSILVWYQNFEKTINSRMAKFAPEHADWLESVNDRIVDLMVPFAGGWYVDKRFRGSASIKNVMPVVAPHLSYKELDVQDGGSAQAVWHSSVYGREEPDRKQLDNLLKYCALDTLAMVEIYRFLHRLVKDSPPSLEQAQLF